MIIKKGYTTTDGIIVLFMFIFIITAYLLYCFYCIKHNAIECMFSRDTINCVILKELKEGSN